MPVAAPEPVTASSRGRWFWVVLAAALIVHAVLGIDAARQWTPTHDEYWHLPYGLYFWQTGDLSADPINPPLVRMWAALPLSVSGVSLDHVGQDPTPYPIGDAFLQAAGPRYHALFWQGRLMILALGLAAATLLALLARQWYGNAAGMIAAILWCGCPTLLSQSIVVTHDLALAAGTVATLAALSYWRDKPTWSRAIVFGACLGLAQMTKLTAVLLYPLCCGWYVLLPRQASTITRAREIGMLACAGLVSWFVLCAGYRFDSVGRSDPAIAPGQSAAVNLAGAALPRPYRQAWQRLRGDLKSQHPIFLNSEWQEGGFPHYYVCALLYKLPLGTLALVLIAAWALCRGGIAMVTHRRAAALVLGVLTFVVPASLSSNQIGLRYVLPAYPCLILFASQAAMWLDWKQTPRCAWLVVLLLATVPLALRYHPHHIAYFNELSGGPIGGREHLVDSNLDWGQDLDALADYVREHVREPISIAYFGSVPPHAVGLTGDPPPQFSPQPGWHAVSVNFVQGRPHTLRLPDGRFDIRGLDAYGYFRFFKPRARIGYSIDVYELSPEDVARFNAARAALR